MPLYAGSVSGKCFPISPKRRCSQQRIHDCMEQDIRIRMSQEPLFIRYFHTANDQVSSSTRRCTSYPIPILILTTFPQTLSVFKNHRSHRLTKFSNRTIPRSLCPDLDGAGCQYRLQYSKILSLFSRHSTVHQILRTVKYIDRITAVLIHLFALFQRRRQCIFRAFLRRQKEECLPV